MEKKFSSRYVREAFSRVVQGLTFHFTFLVFKFSGFVCEWLENKIKNRKDSFGLRKRKFPFANNSRNLYVSYIFLLQGVEQLDCVLEKSKVSFGTTLARTTF